MCPYKIISAELIFPEKLRVENNCSYNYTDGEMCPYKIISTELIFPENLWVDNNCSYNDTDGKMCFGRKQIGVNSFFTEKCVCLDKN